jgi:hypothetical protein
MHSYHSAKSQSQIVPARSGACRRQMDAAFLTGVVSALRRRAARKAAKARAETARTDSGMATRTGERAIAEFGLQRLWGRSRTSSSDVMAYQRLIVGAALVHDFSSTRPRPLCRTKRVTNRRIHGNKFAVRVQLRSTIALSSSHCDGI